MFHHLGIKPIDNFYIMAIVILCVYISWFLVFSEEASAPPIVINTTKTRKENEKFLLTSTNKDGKGIKDTNGLVTMDFPTTNMLGESGLAYAGLGQPCLTQTSKTVNPNLPQGYLQQGCDIESGMECITGIYKGGGICLKSINEKCSIKSDCAPEANFCLNNLCQTRDEVINKSCKVKSDCSGPLGNLNHVCDEKTNRCVYDIWPKDSGCVHESQCRYSAEFPESVECRKSTGKDPNSPAITIGGTYHGSSIRVSDSSMKIFNELKKDITNTYVTVINQKNKGYEGRLRINKILNNNISLTIPSIPERNFQGIEGDLYNLNFGTQKDGICLVKFPTGTKPALIPGSNTSRQLCTSGTSLKNEYCVESGRKTKEGNLEQVCTSDGELSCVPGLSCTYDNTLVNSFNLMINKYHVSSDGLSINGQIIKDIGKCKKQVADIYENCSDNCKKPLVCLSETDINLDLFRYCGYEWDIMNDVSDLTGCPMSNQKNTLTKGAIFNFTDSDTKCKSAIGTFCFSDSDCADKNSKCGNNPITQDKNIYRFTSYDPLLNKYFFNTNKFQGSDLKFLVSNRGNVSGPELVTYYKSNNSENTSWTFVYSRDGLNKFESSNQITINFEEPPVQKPVFSLTYLPDDSNYQLNVEYITKYENSRKREFNDVPNYNFYNAGLRGGTCVYFKDQPHVYKINYNDNYVDLTDKNLTILKVDRADLPGTSVGVSNFTNMITYSSIISAGVSENKFFAIESLENSFHSGDSFTYFSNQNSIQYLNNAGGTSSLVNGTCYFSVMFDKSPLNTSGQLNVSKQIYFTEKYNTVNSNPVLSGMTMNKFGVSVVADPIFSDNNSFIQLNPVFGYHFLPVKISTQNNSPQEITISRRKDYVTLENGDISFNKAIGYFSDTTDITSEITDKSILLTYNYNKNNIQTLSLNYSLEDNSGMENFNKIEMSGGGSCYIYYNINNKITLPNLKITSGVSYSEIEAPYEIDRVRYFENNTESEKNFNTISFMSTYKDIFPNDTRATVGNISVMRKLNLETDLSNQYQFRPKYEGLKNIDPNLSTNLYDPLPFGLTGYVVLSKIVEAINVSETKENLFLGGSNTIIFKKEKDIETILKYGSSELIVSYNDRKRAIAIVGIEEYEVDDKGNEILQVKTSFFINYNDELGKEDSPVLYFNNIYPMATDPDVFKGAFKLYDGRVLISSSKESDMGTTDVFPTLKTNYNKILYNLNASGDGSTSTYSFFDFYFMKEGMQNNPFADGFDPLKPVLLNWTQSTNVFGDLETKYFIEIVSSSNDNNASKTIPSPFDNVVYIINNQYLSSTTLASNSIFLNNDRYYNNFTVLGKYRETDGTISDRSFGGILMKNDTFPFYTGLKDNEGMLDETYLQEIKWPYWIRNLNTGKIVIKKIFLNYNPGNMENNMFYYCLAQVSGVNILLYFSTNFAKNDIKESHSVPIGVTNFEEMSQNMEMIPYNKNLLIFSKSCIRS